MINRESVQNAMVERIVDGMDFRDMCAFIADTLDQQFATYTDEQLMAEARENYPDLIEEN